MIEQKTLEFRTRGRGTTDITAEVARVVAQGHQLEEDNHVLRLQNHVLMLFANRESRIAQVSATGDDG